MRKFTALLALTAVGALPMAAQQAAPERSTRSNTSKLFVALGANGSTVVADEFSHGTEQGGGLTLQVGYGFTPKIAAFLEVASATIRSGADREGYELGHGDLGIRYHFSSPTRAWVPFLEVAASGFLAWQDNVAIEDGQGQTTYEDIEMSGAGLTLGGGVLYFFSPKWAVGTDLKWTTGEFNEVKLGNVTVSGFEISTTTTRLSLGVSWFPMGRR